MPNVSTTRINLPVTRLPHAKDLDLPVYATAHAAGMDLCAAVMQDIVIAPGQRMLIPTGLSIALPERYEAQIRPRSGLAYKNGITVLNAPGTIDADYRGEVQVLLINLGSEPFTITRGMRIAQMIINGYTEASWLETETLGETDRGAGGFGSTGIQKLA